MLCSGHYISHTLLVIIGIKPGVRTQMKYLLFRLDIFLFLKVPFLLFIFLVISKQCREVMFCFSGVIKIIAFF